MEGYSPNPGDAPFNMAVATLMRLDAIHKQLTALELMYPYNNYEKQKQHISLVKQFFLNAINLLDEKYDNKYEELLKLEPNVKTIAKQGVQKFKGVYNKQLEIKLNKLFIEMQQKIRKYYMPKGKDPGKAVAQW